MKITYYQKNTQGGTLIASFGVRLEPWKLEISNLGILPAKNGGFYLVMPTYKNRETEAWGKVVEFDKEAQKKFLDSARTALEEYAKLKGEIIA